MPLTLCQLARKTIEAYFKEEEFTPDEKTKEKFSEKKACFVTLNKKNKLRGCIGCLEARQELWKEIQEMALNAAFHDPRFNPLREEELKEVKIEVSVLGKPKIINYKDEKDLLKKVNKNMGIILRKGCYSATFLPQVWEQIPDKVEFLEHLSIKAGFLKNEWKTADIFYYSVKIEDE